MRRGTFAIASSGIVLFLASLSWAPFGENARGIAAEAARPAAPAAANEDTGEKPAGFPVRPATPKPIKKIYIMTDMEGVAGVRDVPDWCGPEGRYYDVGRRLLTLEVNAAIEGFIRGGAEEIVVSDGHGQGAVDIELLDPRAQLERGWPTEFPGPSLPIGGFDAIAWVGQHAKAGTPYAHLAHTQGFNYLDLSVNGVSIGEFGQLALCASQLGVRAILATGDRALAEEAQTLMPGIETVQVKRGTTPGRGDELETGSYQFRNRAAIHLQPVAARAAIRDGAERAIRRAQREHFGLLTVKPPFVRVARFRPAQRGDPVLISRETHATSVIDLMNMDFHAKAEQP